MFGFSVFPGAVDTIMSPMAWIILRLCCQQFSQRLSLQQKVSGIKKTVDSEVRGLRLCQNRGRYLKARGGGMCLSEMQQSRREAATWEGPGGRKQGANVVIRQAYLLVTTVIVVVLLWFLLSCLLIGRVFWFGITCLKDKQTNKQRVRKKKKMLFVGLNTDSLFMFSKLRDLRVTDVHCGCVKNRFVRETGRFVSLQYLKQTVPVGAWKHLLQKPIYKPTTSLRVLKHPLYDLSSVQARL